ncbi:MAG: tRNA preQ1(34) S-adenosylmethionine ribosyltransferase-isomerase QueA [Candidatus Hydrogenedentes bacterium]|nr:tRNA preQ1(34) S-adenosylmethionine ribosyltransferase-isomerase QueA [Candidatus Hydrogenedentota bacterium]
MKTEELNYNLPEELIAQHPSEQRDASRMMVVHRDSGTIDIDVYRNVSNYLYPGDCMVLNNTRVIRARLHGRKETGGRVEVFLLRELEPGSWIALVRPSGKVKPGCRVLFPAGLSATINEVFDDGRRQVQFNVSNVIQHLEKAGEIPLPPYIKRPESEEQDAHRYQTIFAAAPGAVAAPTAGLHFTDDVFFRLDSKKISRQFLTLHVGYGTFKPVTASTLEEHVVDGEEYEFSEETALALNRVRDRNSRIIAVGTTCTRVLETQYHGGAFHEGKGVTQVYIYPPYQFQAVDAIQTNFHLPKSSLLALVCAFAGTELIRTAYKKAIDERFRFYSYGDVMLIL